MRNAGGKLKVCTTKQTSTIVTGDKLMNPVDYGGERKTSDIIYFATALPDGG